MMLRGGGEVIWGMMNYLAAASSGPCVL